MIDDITLLVGPNGGTRLSGWQSVRISAGIERCPRDFEISYTEHFPSNAIDVSVQPGDPCQVLIGSDVVLTGYVDKAPIEITPDAHGLRIMGRGRCQDLVDCSHELPLSQISGTSALDVAQKLAKPYGIKVTLADGSNPGPPIPQINVMWTETPFNIIERVGHFAQLVAYEQPDGNLLLSQVNYNLKHASGIQMGKNIEHVSFIRTMDQRFSDYVVRIMSFTPWQDSYSTSTKDVYDTEHDPGVPRHRMHAIILDAGLITLGIANGEQIEDVAKRQGIWESNRRWGRSFVCQATIDNWRDSSGALWTPNKLVRIQAPQLKLNDFSYLLGDVVFRRDDTGTHADLRLMPPQAFGVAPTSILPPVLVDAR